MDVKEKRYGTTDDRDLIEEVLCEVDPLLGHPTRRKEIRDRQNATTGFKAQRDEGLGDRVQ